MGFEFAVTEMYMCFLPWVSDKGYPGCQRVFFFRGKAAIGSGEAVVEILVIEDLDRGESQCCYKNKNPLASRVQHVDQGIN